MNETSTPKTAEQIWLEFLELKRDAEWQKALQRFISIDKLPTDLRCKIGAIAMQEAENMDWSLRRETYCLITLHIPERSAEAWEKAQKMGVTKAEYSTFTILHQLTGGINADEAKKIANKVGNAIASLGTKVGKKVKDALEVTPAGKILEDLKKAL